MPHPGLLHAEPLFLRQSTAEPYLLRRYPNTVLSQALWGLWVLVHTVSVVGMGFDSKCDLSLLPSCWGFSFALGHEVSFLGGIQHSPLDGCSAGSCNFGVLADKMSTHHSTPSSLLLHPKYCHCIISAYHRNKIINIIFVV